MDKHPEKKEKKVYEEPKISIVRIEWADIITASSEQGNTKKMRFGSYEPGTEGGENA